MNPGRKELNTITLSYYNYQDSCDIYSKMLSVELSTFTNMCAYMN